MSARAFVIELRGGPASTRRTLEGLDLAAGLAAFGHEVRLVLAPAAIAALAGARAETELGERLALVAEAGVGPALTGAADPPARLGALALERGDPDALRPHADAVLVF